METKLVRIAEISVTSKHPIFTSVYHLINEDMLKQCHKELAGNKAVGIDKVTKDGYRKKGLTLHDLSIVKASAPVFSKILQKKYMPLAIFTEV